MDRGGPNDLLGYHFVVTSAVLVMGLELLAIAAVILPVALVVRKITGKTLVELTCGDRASAPSLESPNDPPS